MTEAALGLWGFFWGLWSFSVPVALLVHMLALLPVALLVLRSPTPPPRPLTVRPAPDAAPAVTFRVEHHYFHHHEVTHRYVRHAWAEAPRVVPGEVVPASFRRELNG